MVVCEVVDCTANVDRNPLSRAENLSLSLSLSLSRERDDRINKPRVSLFGKFYGLLSKVFFCLFVCLIIISTN